MIELGLDSQAGSLTFSFKCGGSIAAEQSGLARLVILGSLVVSVKAGGGLTRRVS